VGTSCIAVAVIDGACIVVVAVNGCFSATSLVIATISVALVSLTTRNWSVNTTSFVITRVGSADIVVIADNGNGRATDLVVACIGVAFTISNATVRVICVDAS
jgi:hypothetical protein